MSGQCDSCDWRRYAHRLEEAISSKDDEIKRLERKYGDYDKIKNELAEMKRSQGRAYDRWLTSREETSNQCPDV